MSRLCIDSGNTRIKWGLHDRDGWRQRGAVAQTEHGMAVLDEAWSNLALREAPPQRILISNVAGSAAHTALLRLLARWPIAPTWLAAAPTLAGVHNTYAVPTQLGSDRWAALIAAWHLEQRACLAVNVGTAMTVDALSDSGEFLGGIIVAGYDLMRGALAQRTDGLNISSGAFHPFPRNTADALHSGAVQAMAGAIERMAAVMEGSPICLISGGAAGLLLPHLQMPVRVVEEMVLEGLRVIADADPTQIIKPGKTTV